jgi:Mlc titration factor MtfA (ptsG expression regulator)
MAQPFPRAWEAVLQSRVVYFTVLDEEQKERFRQLVKIFLDEIRITGIRTDVDETTRVLVAASAIIPVFNFDQWEYSRLGEVLIYPGSFDEEYQTDRDGQPNTLGMVGTGHLSGVMILSKPSLIGGFDNAGDKQNVGIHEFAHLVDRADGVIDGIPPGVPAELARSWIQWVAEELADGPDKRSHINPYGYTNEAEYFAVLMEYFFEAPGVLQQKNPELYAMLQKMTRQDTASFLAGAKRPRSRRIGRNSRCPCGSGKKYKKCCLRAARQGVPAAG